MNSSYAKGFLSALLLVGLFAAGFFLVPGSVDAQKKNKKSPIVDAGTVPQEYGDLVGFAGRQNSLYMMFKDEKGVLRYVEINNANKVVDRRVFEITRPY